MSKIAFLTNARQYVGPAAIGSMTERSWTVFCHDDTFGQADERERFEADNANCAASAQPSPAGFVEEGLSRFGRIDALISNDIPKGIGSLALPSDPLQHFEDFVESLLIEPVRLLRAALPAMREAGSGSIVLITSGAPLCNPAAGGPHGYNAGRAGAHGLMKGLAKELAPLGIQVNAVAPYYVFNNTFFPSEIGPEDPRYAPMIERVIPMNRFGRQEEIGHLIYLLAGGDARFISGQVVAFSGAGS